MAGYTVAQTIKVGNHNMVVIADAQSGGISYNPPTVHPHLVISMFDTSMLFQQLADILHKEGWDVGVLTEEVVNRP